MLTAREVEKMSLFMIVVCLLSDLIGAWPYARAVGQPVLTENRGCDIFNDGLLSVLSLDGG